MATGYNCVWMLIVYGLYVYFGEEIISLFLNDEATSVSGATNRAEIIAVGVEYLTIVGATYIFLGVAVVISSALSGAGATRACLVIDASVLLGIVVPLTVAMWNFTELTPTQTWYLIAIGNLLSAIGYAAWFGKKSWIHKVV